jgi:hypothetical protein
MTYLNFPLQIKLPQIVFLTLVLTILGGSFVKSYAATTPHSLPDNKNQIGINIASPLDFEEDRLYADVIRTSREFIAGTNENSKDPANIDVNGWPTADFSFYVWGSRPKMHGTYTLSFKGHAKVTSNPGIRIPISYDATTNTSSGSFDFENTERGAFALTFSNTKRSNDSAFGTGVTSIKCKRSSNSRLVD